MAGAQNFSDLAELFFGGSTQFESHLVKFLRKSKFGLVRHFRFYFENKRACGLYLSFNNLKSFFIFMIKSWFWTKKHSCKFSQNLIVKKIQIGSIFRNTTMVGRVWMVTQIFSDLAEPFFGGSTQFESHFVKFLRKSKFGLVRHISILCWK